MGSRTAQKCNYKGAKIIITMSLEINHEHKCSNCDNEPSKDKCFCEDCVEEAKNEAYSLGKEAGHKEGYNEGFERASLSN